MRYTVPGVPPGLACSAFTPNMTRLARSGAQSYKYALEGQPGTKAIPAPTRDTAPSPDNGDLVLSAQSRSSNAPDVWYPQQYYQHFIAEAPGAGMPIKYYDPVHPGPTTLLPVPAVDLRGLYQRASARLSEPIVQRGGMQIRAIRNLIRWPGNNDG